VDIIILPVILVALWWIAPILIIGVSDETSGFEKMLWLLSVLVVSWFAWILFVLLAPVRSKH